MEACRFGVVCWGRKGGVAVAKVRLSYPVDELRGTLDRSSGMVIRRSGGLNIVSRARVSAPPPSAGQMKVRTAGAVISAGWNALATVYKTAWNAWAAARAAEGTFWSEQFQGVDAYRQVNFPKYLYGGTLQGFAPALQPTRTADSIGDFKKDYAGYSQYIVCNVGGSGTALHWFLFYVNGPLWGEGAAIDSKGWVYAQKVQSAASVVGWTTGSARPIGVNYPSREVEVGDWMAVRVLCFSNQWWLGSVAEGVVQVT